jgi:hypothetical protein
VAFIEEDERALSIVIASQVLLELRKARVVLLVAARKEGVGREDQTLVVLQVGTGTEVALLNEAGRTALFVDYVAPILPGDALHQLGRAYAVEVAHGILREVPVLRYPHQALAALHPVVVKNAGRFTAFPNTGTVTDESARACAARQKDLVLLPYKRDGLQLDRRDLLFDDFFGKCGLVGDLRRGHSRHRLGFHDLARVRSALQGRPIGDIGLCVFLVWFFAAFDRFEVLPLGRGYFFRVWYRSFVVIIRRTAFSTLSGSTCSSRRRFRFGFDSCRRLIPLTGFIDGSTRIRPERLRSGIALSIAACAASGWSSTAF